MALMCNAYCVLYTTSLNPQNLRNIIKKLQKLALFKY